jgi:hypothetical protein
VVRRFLADGEEALTVRPSKDINEIRSEEEIELA